MVPYDELLADRIRELLAGRSGVAEKKMFGGLAFLVEGNLAIAASGQGGVLVRADPADTDRHLSAPGVGLAVMRGRPMEGWLRVDDEHLKTGRQLSRWVEVGTSYARSLPPKAKSAPRRRSASGEGGI